MANHALRRMIIQAAAYGCGATCLVAPFVEAAAPRTNRTSRSVAPSTSRRPTTTQPVAKPAPNGTKPAAKIAPLPDDGLSGAGTKAGIDAPTPPQPRRETMPPPKAAKAVPVAPLPAQTMPATAQPRTTELFAPPPAGASIDKNQKYVFRYQFARGETVRWVVEHKAKIASTVDGSSQTAETSTTSVKAWKVVEVFPGGETKFVNSVDSIDMRQKLTGRQETRYNSRTDKDVPPMFAVAAKQVGVPLAEVTIDARGNVQKRVDLKKAAAGGEPQETAATDITLILPDKPLAVGESWTAPLDLWAMTKENVRVPIKARRKVTLESVSGHTARLRHETQILSPLDDPHIEAQVVQSEQAGEVTFDLSRGRIVTLSLTNDREVFGFQGDASVMHVEAAFTERLADADGEPLPEASEATTTARSPKSGAAASEASTPQPAVRQTTNNDKTAGRPTATKAK